MFTGLVTELGKVVDIKRGESSAIFTISAPSSTSELSVGDSIAVNGVCLTAVELGEHFFYADVSNETLSRTILNSSVVGTSVNLELALTPATRMGGHIVSGHVDGIGVITEKKADGRSYRFIVKAPDDLAKYIAEKGSICINGISLTINEVKGASFSVNIVPYTLKDTTLGEALVGTKVNLEVDLLARYMERLIQGDSAACVQDGITEDLLHKSGFFG